MSSHYCQSAIGHNLSEGLDRSRTGSVMCLALSGPRKDGEVAGGSIYSLASKTSSCRIRIRADCRPSLHAARQPGSIDSVDGPYSTHMRYNRSTGTPSCEADAHCHASKTDIWPLIRQSARVRWPMDGRG